MLPCEGSSSFARPKETQCRLFPARTLLCVINLIYQLTSKPVLIKRILSNFVGFWLVWGGRRQESTVAPLILTLTFCKEINRPDVCDFVVSAHPWLSHQHLPFLHCIVEEPIVIPDGTRLQWCIYMWTGACLFLLLEDHIYAYCPICDLAQKNLTWTALDLCAVCRTLILQWLFVQKGYSSLCVRPAEYPTLCSTTVYAIAGSGRCFEFTCMHIP